MVRSLCGSAPHTRGTGSRDRGRDRPNRFSPAHAGNGERSVPPIVTDAVQPRTRGERSWRAKSISGVLGSAPHTRGTASMCRQSRRTKAVQPRTRGERSNGVAEDGWYAGSAPHTRGTALADVDSHRQKRFSPAHAGNGLSARSRFALRSVQPRTRGERFITKLANKPNGGSAPHTRGTARMLLLRQARERFSPAHAGNGVYRYKVGAEDAVQPRTRGERVMRSDSFWSSFGSAPHTRGTG